MLKRNTITALGLIVLAVIESAVSQNEPTVCDYQKCQDIVKHGVNCSTVAAAIECAQTTILPNPDCSQIVKDVARRKIQEGEEYLRQHCSPPFTVTEPAVSHEPYEPCDYEVCLVYLLEYDLTCSTAAAAIECVQTSVLPNPECSQIVKDQARGNLQEGEEYIRQHCPPLFTDGCCLKVSRMADATTTSDMRMEVEDGRCYYNIRHEVTIHCVAEPAVPPEPTVCHSEFCQLMPDEYVLTCSNVADAIECVQTTILPNPECSQIAKDEARRKIQEGEEYLRQHCPPPFTDEPVRVARAAVSLCEPARCLDGLNNDGVTCSTVTEAIQCAETTILTNPYCSANVKDLTKDKVWEGLQYMMRNCCAQSSDNTTLCDVGRCMDGVNEYGLTCRSVTEGIHCAETTFLNIPECSQCLKEQVENARRYAIAFLDEYCPFDGLDAFQWPYM